ncbi:tRNA-specific adenosine deaminase 1 [Plasmopara halstedii]|uniref:tRNA-specific adenosine deaminase 1 n=1 Tax=Plasmopara halstedii TaxID=4781 RepID=A0A0P1ATG5_PLAHL|nr:tRNA-specific adenosine deaminase 1 [Plasmopara halstedii]CEG44576.1 tRNA-specific adenosine deaminase 1 [Plasmopara halstedii]|eukprot:XP_024580945.1 tRNA-specific adenosine deaminase 1 [Plasmopara halstedii]
MLSPDITSGVAHAVLQWFTSSVQCQNRIPSSQWTVLSAATGNKCLGRRDLNADGLAVNDCHAEVLARRAFMRYLYAEALLWQEDGQESNLKSIFMRHPTLHRLVLKPQNSLHLFISESPCGDAAIYELKQDVVDRLVQYRQSKEIGQYEKRQRTEFRLTGAKVQNKRLREADSLVYQDTPSDNKFSQVVGVARVKSGRSDLPLDKQTLSMSCSDKIARWNALGLQGSLLLQWFDPVYLRSIVVMEDFWAISVEKQEQALRRAVCVRLKERNALVEGALVSCETSIVSGFPQFSRRRTSYRTPSSLAVNWTTRESWTRVDRWSLGAGATEAFEFIVRFFSRFDLEFLIAATGFKQGAQKASDMDQAALEKVASRLAKKNMLRAFDYLLGHHSDCTIRLNYLQLKQLDEMIAISTSPRTTNALIGCKICRHQFFHGFSDWIGTPSSFKQFKL